MTRLWIALSASIAIAGCHGRANPIPDWRDDELKPSTYRFLATTADETERPLLRRFMADGKITYGELAELNDFNESRASPLDDVKRELAQ